MRQWDDVIPDEERSLYRQAGLGELSGGGTRPVLLVVDATIDFTGDRAEPAADSIKRFPLSCGESAWLALPTIARVIQAAREHRVPIFYTRQASRANELLAGAWGRKNASAAGRPAEAERRGMAFPDIIAPLDQDLILEKDKPSAFFGTALESYLTAVQADTVIVTGTSTSGCVRATAVDAFSYNYHVVVVEDGVFDRATVPHKVALFDLHSKYADVLAAGEVCEMLRFSAHSGDHSRR